MGIYTAALTAASTATLAMVNSSAAWADELTTQSTVMGVTTTELQKMQYASNFLDVSVETTNDAMKGMLSQMRSAKEGGEGAIKMFENLGVSITDSNGEMRNSNDVYLDVIDALGKVENQTERDTAAMAIFGKQGRNLNPLIEAGSSALREFGDEAERNGVIVGEDGVKALNDYNDSLDRLKSTAGASKNLLSTVFAGDMTKMADTLTEGIPNITSAIAGVLNGEDGAKEDVEKSTNELMDGIVENITASAPKHIAAFNSIVLGVGKSLISNAPEMVDTLLPTVIGGFGDLVGGIVGVLPETIPKLTESIVTTVLSYNWLGLGWDIIVGVGKGILGGIGGVFKGIGNAWNNFWGKGNKEKATENIANPETTSVFTELDEKSLTESIKVDDVNYNKGIQSANVQMATAMSATKQQLEVATGSYVADEKSQPMTKDVLYELIYRVLKQVISETNLTIEGKLSADTESVFDELFEKFYLKLKRMDVLR